MRYKLNKAQMEFFKSQDKYAVFCGGLGSGKSFALQLACITTALLYPEALHCYTSLSYSLLRDATIPALFRMLDDCQVPYEYIKSEQCLILNRKTKLILRSQDTADRLRSVEIGSLFCDELAYFSKMNFQTLVGRLRDSRGPLVMRAATTPLGKNWFYDMFVEQGQGSLYRGSSRENKHLPDGYLDTLCKNYDSKLRRQEIDGEFLAATEALAYYFWSEQLVKGVKFDPARGTIYVGMDFNVSKMSTALCQYHEGVLYVFAEIVQENSNTFNMVRAIKEYINSLKTNVPVRIIPDSTGSAKKSCATKTDHEIIREAGFTIPPFRNPLRHDRFNAMNSTMEKGHIIVDSACTHLLKDFREYDGIEEHGNMGHISDAVGYVLWHIAPIKRPRVQLSSRVL
jgi:PBSX family phage terminase large subunit